MYLEIQPTPWNTYTLNDFISLGTETYYPAKFTWSKSTIQIPGKGVKYVQS